MSNIIIPAEHQSAPKPTELDIAVRKTIAELRDGTYRPDRTVASFDPTKDDYFKTGTEVIEQHPRVQEALAKLQTQIVDKTNNEYLEKAEMLHELNLMQAAEFKWSGQARWQGPENIAMRKVNPMSPFEFIQKLIAAGVSAAVEPEMTQEWKFDENNLQQLYDVERSSAKICLGRTVYRDLVAVRAWVNGEYVMVDKLQVPAGPEWTIMRFDDLNLPTDEAYHGWRTAVLALIIRGVITEKEAQRAFGPVVENAASSFYRQQLFEWRNGVSK